MVSLSVFVMPLVLSVPQPAPVLPAVLEAFVTEVQREDVYHRLPGRGDRDPFSYYRKTMGLNRSVPTEAWMQLSHHESPMVRGWAFLALMKRTDVELLPLLLRYLEDETPVAVSVTQCVVLTKKVGEFAFEAASPHLSEDERQEAYRWLVLNENDLQTRYEAFRKVEPDSRVYPKLITLAKKERTLTDEEQTELSNVRYSLQSMARWKTLELRGRLKGLAIIALARYGTDNHFIESALGDTSAGGDSYTAAETAVITHPKTSFLPLLARRLGNTSPQEWNHAKLYTAIAVHRSPEAARLLVQEKKRTGSLESRDRHWTALMAAMSTYPNPIFNALMFELWSEGALINQAGFDYLYAQDPVRTITLAKADLADIDTFIERRSSPFISDRNELALHLWKSIMNHDPVAGTRSFETLLGGEQLHSSEFVDHVSTLHDLHLIARGARALTLRQSKDEYDEYLLDQLVSRLTSLLLDGEDPASIARAVQTISRR